MDKNEVLNVGLSLAMEFGENWLQPIQSPLAKIFPNLSSRELDEYDSICNAVMESGNKLVHSMVERDGTKTDQKEWEALILHSYPWINRKNLGRLFSQGMYYACK